MRKKVLTLIMALAMLLSLVPTVLAADFKDQADVDEWAEEAVDRWHEEEVLNGGANGNFDPKGELTRAQAAQTIVNLMNLEGSGKTADLSKFADYDTAVKGQWSEDALEIAVAAGIIKGVGRGDENLLDPNGTVSREMMFVMIARALGIPEADEADKDIPDIENASDWAVGSINALVNIGAIKGVDPAGTVDPASDINRQTTAVLFDQLIGGYANKDGETATIEEGRITLIVADNVKVEGTADPDMPIIVAGAAANVDMEKVEGEAEVQVNVSDVKIENAPVGTTVAAAEGITGVTVNDETVEAGKDVVVEEPEPTPTPTPTPGPALHTVTLGTHDHAKVELNPTSAAAGTTITVTVTPDIGYEVESVTATGATVSGSGNTYSFTMPSADVKVTVETEEVDTTYRIVLDATHGSITLKETAPEGSACWGGNNTCYGGKNGDQGAVDWISLTVTCKPSELTLAKFGYVKDKTFTLTADTDYTGYAFFGWYALTGGKAAGTAKTDYDPIKADTNLGSYAKKSTDGKENLVVLSAVWKAANEEEPTCYGGENSDKGYTDGTSGKPGVDPAEQGDITIYFDATLGYISIKTNKLDGSTCFGGDNTCFGGENTCYGGENADQSGADWISLTGKKGDTSLKLSDLGINADTFNMKIDATSENGAYKDYKFAGWFVFKDGQYKKADEKNQQLNLLDYLDGNQVVLYAGWAKEGTEGSTCYGGNNDGTGYGSYTDGTPGIPANVQP